MSYVIRVKVIECFGHTQINAQCMALFTYIWVVLGVNGEYTIHSASGTLWGKNVL